jgi:hypothetical protein
MDDDCQTDSETLEMAVKHCERQLRKAIEFHKQLGFMPDGSQDQLSKKTDCSNDESGWATALGSIALKPSEEATRQVTVSQEI